MFWKRDKANYGKVCQSTFGKQPIFFLFFPFTGFKIILLRIGDPNTSHCINHKVSSKSRGVSLKPKLSQITQTTNYKDLKTLVKHKFHIVMDLKKGWNFFGGNLKTREMSMALKDSALPAWSPLIWNLLAASCLRPFLIWTFCSGAFLGIVLYLIILKIQSPSFN